MAQSAALRIGTRGSPLALVQARAVRDRLAAALGRDAGHDRAQGHPHHRRHHRRPAAGRGGRQGPVHQGDRGGAAARRHRPRRAFGQGHADAPAGRLADRGLSRARRPARCVHQQQGEDASTDLPHGAKVGTASLRRQAIMKRTRPDLDVAPLRGNVETRLRKLDDGEADAIILGARRPEAARAGSARDDDHERR